MDDREPLPLIPYSPPTSREIVLQHGSSIVVYDPQSNQVSLWGEMKPQPQHNEPDSCCPMCGRPFGTDGGYNGDPGRRPSGSRNVPRRETPQSDPTEQMMNSGYFKLLNSRIQASAGPRPRELSFDLQADSSRSQSSSRPAEPRPSRNTSFTSQGISSTAFSQNYFRTFFVEEGELGRGGKGVVLLVRHVLDGVSLGHFACKRVPVGDNHDWLKRVLREVQFLQGLSHQNLVSYRHVWLEDCQLTKFGPSVPCAFILQQYCNAGDLLHYILRPNRSSEELRALGQLNPFSGSRMMNFDDIFSFFKDITAGVHHLHSHGYLHRDLKPSNCLLHHTGSRIRVLVSDFGEVQQISDTRRSTGATGTISYCAPEVLRPNLDGTFENFTVKSDIFSLGMIVYFMCFAQSPFKNADDLYDENEDIDALRKEICEWQGFDVDEKEKRHLRPDLPGDLYRSLKRLLSLDPIMRPDTADILQGITLKIPSSQRAGSPRPNRMKRSSTSGKSVGDGPDGTARFPVSYSRGRPDFSAAQSTSSGVPSRVTGGSSSGRARESGPQALKKIKRFQAYVSDEPTLNNKYLENPPQIEYPSSLSPRSESCSSSSAEMDAGKASEHDHEDESEGDLNDENRFSGRRKSAMLAAGSLFSASAKGRPLSLLHQNTSSLHPSARQARRYSATTVHELHTRNRLSGRGVNFRTSTSPPTKESLRRYTSSARENNLLKMLVPGPRRVASPNITVQDGDGYDGDDKNILVQSPLLLSPVLTDDSDSDQERSGQSSNSVEGALVPLSKLAANSASSSVPSSNDLVVLRNSTSVSFPSALPAYSDSSYAQGHSLFSLATVINLSKLALFLVKYHILNSACLATPHRSMVAMPLMTLALLDFFIPIGSYGWGSSSHKGSRISDFEMKRTKFETTEIRTEEISVACGGNSVTSTKTTAERTEQSRKESASTLWSISASAASPAPSGLDGVKTCQPSFQDRWLSQGTVGALVTSVFLTVAFWLTTNWLRKAGVLCYL